MGSAEEIRQKTKKREKRRKIRKIILLTLLLIITFFTTKFAIITHENGGGLKGVVKTALGAKKDEVLPIFNILILGTSQGNTDTIMVAGYNPQTNEASILSIPRDTFIGKDINNGGGGDKINAVYRTKGIEEMLKKASNIVGFEVKNYVVIDTKAVVNLVDKIGGVEFDVPINMNYHDITQKLSIELKAGKQKLNGKQAEGVLRFRHNDDGTTYPQSYGIEDRGRNRTQQAFIKEAMKQTIQLKNITKIFDIIDIVNQNVKTNVDVETMKRYATKAIDFEPSHIKTGIVPGKDIKTTAWFFEPNKKELEKTRFNLFVYSDDPRKIKFNEEEYKQNDGSLGKENQEKGLNKEGNKEEKSKGDIATNKKEKKTENTKKGTENKRQ